MNRKFRSDIEALIPKFSELSKMAPTTLCERHGRDIPARGVYLLSEGTKHIYVGRSNGIHTRLARHCRDSASHNSASFAFLLARQELGYKRHDFKRAELMKSKKFLSAFARAKARIRKMDLRYIEEQDPTRQALLEIYTATALKTPYNEFDTH